MAMSANSGTKLRQLRIQRGLSLRDVQSQSRRLALKYQNTGLIVSPSRLNAVEKTNAVPNLLRAWALARIYKCGMGKLLKCFGLIPIP